MTDATEFICPTCGSSLQKAPGASNILKCPACKGEFFAAEQTGEAAAGADEMPDDASHEANLNAARIRMYASARRAAYRARSYCIVAALTGAGIAIELTWSMIRQVRDGGSGVTIAAYALFALLGAGGLIYFARRARAFGQEATRPIHESDSRFKVLPGSASASGQPDFSKLDNASKWARNMDQIR
jgi:hypothetical protein